MASFAVAWDSSGFTPGNYLVEVAIRDMNGALLDSKSQPIVLGISSGQITHFAVTPEIFDIGDRIDISLAFANAGTVPIQGMAVIKVQTDSGADVQEFRHDIVDLKPGETAYFDDVWNTSGAASGSYRITGNVRYGSKASAVRIATLGTKRPLYLPLTLQSSR